MSVSHWGSQNWTWCHTLGLTEGKKEEESLHWTWWLHAALEGGPECGWLSLLNKRPQWALAVYFPPCPLCKAACCPASLSLCGCMGPFHPWWRILLLSLLNFLRVQSTSRLSRALQSWLPFLLLPFCTDPGAYPEMCMSCPTLQSINAVLKACFSKMSVHLIKPSHVIFIDPAL